MDNADELMASAASHTLKDIMSKTAVAGTGERQKRMKSIRQLSQYVSQERQREQTSSIGKSASDNPEEELNTMTEQFCRITRPYRPKENDASEYKNNTHSSLQENTQVTNTNIQSRFSAVSSQAEKRSEMTKQDSKLIRTGHKDLSRFSIKEDAPCRSNLQQRTDFEGSGDKSHQQLEIGRRFLQLQKSVEDKNAVVEHWKNKYLLLERETSTLISSLQKNCEELQKNLKVLNKMLEEERECKDKLQKENQVLQKLCRGLKTENQTVEKEVLRLMNFAKENKEETVNIEGKTATQGDKETETEQVNANLETSIRVKRELKNSTVAPDLSLLKDVNEEINHRKEVQVFCNQRNELINTFIEDFSTVVKSKLNIEDPELNLLHVPDILEISPKKPILVVCFSVHASDSAVQKALAGINATCETVLILVHLKEPHALPSVPSDRKLSEVVRSGLGGVFDLAFVRDRGLYSCPMNDYNIAGIVNFIKTSG